ncbi:hypothetical protein ABZ960_42765, partial [Streptomyces pseudovenezuelae]
ILNAALDTTAPDNTRTTAVDLLGERWLDREETHATVFNIALDTTAPDNTRAIALDVLGDGWSDREETHATVLNIARDTTAPDHTRTIALQTLAMHWPDQDGWSCTASCIQGTKANLREIAVRLLALMWPQTSETAALLINAAESDVSAEVRTTAEQAVAYLEAIAEINASSAPA